MRPAWKKANQSGARRVTFPRPAAGLSIPPADAAPAEVVLLERLGLVDDSTEFAASKWGDDE